MSTTRPHGGCSLAVTLPVVISGVMSVLWPATADAAKVVALVVGPRCC